MNPVYGETKQITVGTASTAVVLTDFTLTGDTDDTNTDHSHGVGSLTIPSSGNHSHSYVTNTSNYSHPIDGGDDRTGYITLNNFGGSTTYGDASHTHTISGNTGTALSNTQHKHPYTTASINGNVTQTAHISPYLALNMFIFLGV